RSPGVLARGGGERPVVQHGRDAGGELAGAERLGEERGAQLLRLAEHALVALAGEDDDGETTGGADAAQLPQQLEPRAVGEMEVEQQRVDRGMAGVRRR